MDFFKKQATSFLSAEKKEDAPAASDAAPKKTGSGETPGYQELLGSANVLLDAAKGGNKGEKLDTAKLADAAEDLLQATSRYGKLEGTQVGGYVKQAETYLQSYKSRDVADVDTPAQELKKSAEEVKETATKKVEEVPKPEETTEVEKVPEPEETPEVEKVPEPKVTPKLKETPKPEEEKVEAPLKPSED